MANGIVKKLSEDVVICILLRLTVKPLLRFKCVSRTLYTLIRSSTFMNFHLTRTTTTNNEFILFKRSIREETNRIKLLLSFVSADNDGDDLFPISPDVDMSFLTTIYSGIAHRLLGPCNGLIALTDKVNTMLLNPATRHYRILKPSPFDCALGFHRSINGIGFGFSSIANDYKIVSISTVHGEPPFYDFNLREQKAEVYELSIDSWRELDHVDNQLPHFHGHPCSDLYYKGASHWFGSANMLVIFCFDMSTEIFRNLEMPNTCHSNDGKSYGLIVLNECLSLICYPYSGSLIDISKDLMDIWIMKEYGVNETWIKKYTVRPLSIYSPLAVWKDRLLLFQSKNGVLLSYDLNSDEVKKFNLHGLPESLSITVYKESLTLIPKGNKHSTQVQKFWR